MEKFGSHVHRLFEGNLEKQSTALGLHGTSWEAIEHLVAIGNLPSSSTKTINAKADHPEGRIYFSPAINSLPNHDLAHTFPPSELAVKRVAEGYAGDIARVHYFIRILQLDINDRILSVGCRAAVSIARHHKEIRDPPLFFESIQEQRGYDHLRRLGVSDEKIAFALQATKTRRGIVLSIGRNVLDDFELADGDIGNGDLSIICPDGLPIQYITGIEPLGDFEYHQLNALQDT